MSPVCHLWFGLKLDDAMDLCIKLALSAPFMNNVQEAIEYVANSNHLNH